MPIKKLVLVKLAWFWSISNNQIPPLMMRISKGLDLPIRGVPRGRTFVTTKVKKVALLGADYVGLRPTMLVRQGNRVKIGTPLFEDKTKPGVIFTSPAAGKVIAINRGAKRALQSVVIELSARQVHHHEFAGLSTQFQEKISEADVRERLQKSGVWCALRTRPFNKVPLVDSKPYAIFVNAMDSDPLALDPQLVLAKHQDDFNAGLRALVKFAPIHVCHAKGFHQPKIIDPNIKYHLFSGKHPAGLTGTHMHFIAPVNKQRVNWSLNYQDLIAIGHLFAKGKIFTTRYLSLGGPAVARPTLLETQQGASIDELLVDKLAEGMGKKRVISGSVLSGNVADDPSLNFVGRYHLQVGVILDDNSRYFMSWLSPGFDRFSAQNIYISKLMPRKRFKFTSSTNGSERAMVPIGAYERVMPLDILATQLLRALIVEDIQSAEELGCLELVEEDLALCTFVCPGKYEYGALLRRSLERIEKEL